MDEDKIDEKHAKVVVAIVNLVVFLFGMAFGLFIQDVPSYKQGQLDYQAGVIEWTRIDGAVHHIERSGE